MANKKPLVTGDAPAVVRQIGNTDVLEVPEIALGNPLSSAYGGLGAFINGASGWSPGHFPVMSDQPNGMFVPSLWRHYEDMPIKGVTETIMTSATESPHFYGVALVAGRATSDGTSYFVVRADTRDPYFGTITYVEFGFGSDGRATFPTVVADEAVLGATTFTGEVSLASVVTPSPITANQNDYAAINGARWGRISSTAAFQITGFSGGASGLRRLVTNVGTFNITIMHQSSSSSAANRVLCPGNANFVLNANDSCEMIYDSSRWRVLRA